MARIILSQHGRLTNTYFSISSTHAVTIGRGFDNEVQLDDEAISPRHAQVTLEFDDQGNMRYFLEDLGSISGSFLNKQKVKRHQLKHKDRFRIGFQEFTFFNYKELISRHTNEKPSK